MHDTLGIAKCIIIMDMNHDYYIIIIQYLIINNILWTMSNEQQVTNNEQWVISNEQWVISNEQWAMSNKQWTINNKQ